MFYLYSNLTRFRQVLPLKWTDKENKIKRPASKVHKLRANEIQHCASRERREAAP